jgi:hypothetical protein
MSLAVPTKINHNHAGHTPGIHHKPSAISPSHFSQYHACQIHDNDIGSLIAVTLLVLSIIYLVAFVVLKICTVDCSDKYLTITISQQIGTIVLKDKLYQVTMANRTRHSLPERQVLSCVCTWPGVNICIHVSLDKWLK